MDINELQALTVPDLQKFAQDVGGKDFAGLRKQDLIKEILLLINHDMLVFRLLPFAHLNFIYSNLGTFKEFKKSKSFFFANILLLLLCF